MMIKTMLIVSLTASAVSAAPKNPNPWELANEEDDFIKVYRRDVPDSDVAEAKAELIVNQPAERVWEVVNDIEHYVEFMPYIEETKIMGPVGKGHYVYHRIDPPLVSKREYTLEIINEKEDDNGVWLRTWTLADNKGPPPLDGVVHLTVSDGSWRLEKLGSRSTLVTYWVYTDSGGAIPDWIANRANTTSLPDVMRAVRNRAKNPKWKRED